MTLPLQKIYFGPPGSGKSHKANELAEETITNILNEADSDSPDPKLVRERIVTTVFHPETTYGDFTAKLLPMSDDSGSVKYEVHAGPFVQALALALNDLDKPVVLIIDEINRGPCAAIFGDLFQLLDRGDQGHSQYDINVPKLLVQALKQQGIEEIVSSKDESEPALFKPATGRLRLPANLHLLGTMNTSDESVYAMDAAFKRRWEWEFVKWDDGIPAQAERASIRGGIKQDSMGWYELLEKLNDWISKNAYGAAIDDKLIGYRFLKLKFARGASQKNGWTRLEVNFSEEEVKPGKFQSIWAKLHNECQKFPVHIPIEEKLKLDLNFVHENAKCPVDSVWKDGPGKNCFHPDIRMTGGGGSQFTSQGLAKAAQMLIDKLNEAAEKHVKSLETGNYESVKRVLPHHLWDNVFSRDRTPIKDLIKLKNEKADVRTYGEFIDHLDTFLEQIMKGPEEWKRASEGR